MCLSLWLSTLSKRGGEEPVSWDFDDEGNRYEKGSEDDPDQINKKVKEEDLAADDMDVFKVRTALKDLLT